MEKMQQFMVVHSNPGIDCKVVQSNWRKMAKLENARWVRTYMNEKEGLRYCIWLSPNQKELKDIFDQMQVSYESITPVVETVPDMWGDQWQEHLKKDAAADTLGAL
jgi:phage-related protein